MAEHFANEFATTLIGAITSGATSLQVASSSGAPAPNFRIRIDDEKLLVTAGPPGSTTWTVTREIEGTTAATHANGAAVQHVLTAGGLLQAIRDASAPILNYAAASDLLNGAAVSAGVWLDCGTNQTFTVADATATITIVMQLGALISGGTPGALASSAIMLDSAGAAVRYVMGSGSLQVNGIVTGELTCGMVPLILTGLSAGAHTIKAQIYCAVAATAYCRAATAPNGEYLRFKVLEG